MRRDRGDAGVGSLDDRKKVMVGHAFEISRETGDVMRALDDDRARTVRASHLDGRIERAQREPWTR